MGQTRDGCAVLTICGSLQAASANRAALDVVTDLLSNRASVTVHESIGVGTVPVFDPDCDEAGRAVEEFRRQLHDSDVVVIATPEYAGSLPGALKNALDWIVGSAELYAKPVVVISAGTSGGMHARHHLIQSLTWQGAHVVASLGIAAPRTKTAPTGAFTDPATIASLMKIAELAISAPSMPPTRRMECIIGVLDALGIGREHIAPLPEP